MMLTYDTDGWSCDTPTEFPPAYRVISYHLVDSIIEAVNPVSPGNSDALEKYQEQQTKPADGIRV